MFSQNLWTADITRDFFWLYNGVLLNVIYLLESNVIFTDGKIINCIQNCNTSLIVTFVKVSVFREFDVHCRGYTYFKYFGFDMWFFYASID